MRSQSGYVLAVSFTYGYTSNTGALCQSRSGYYMISGLSKKPLGVNLTIDTNLAKIFKNEKSFKVAYNNTNEVLSKCYKSVAPFIANTDVLAYDLNYYKV